jgi:hypothetical protein
MKKIIIFSLLLLSITTFSQETFVRNYKYMIVTENDVSGINKKAELTVVFNPNKQKGIKFYYANGKIAEYYQVSDLTEGKTEAGQEYQLIEIVDKEEGLKIILQLFDKIGVLRLIFSAGNTIEFYE